MVKLISDGFDANGVPPAALTPLGRLRLESEARGGAWFNDAESFKLATAKAFEAREQVFASLTSSRTLWRGEASQVMDLSRMIRVATMCAREGHEEVAIDVLRQALEAEDLASAAAQQQADDEDAAALRGSAASRVTAKRWRAAFQKVKCTSSGLGAELATFGGRLALGGLAMGGVQQAGDGWRLRVARWMVAQELSPPWIASFVHLAKPTIAEVSGLVRELGGRDLIFVGRSILAFDEKSRTWRQVPPGTAARLARVVPRVAFLGCFACPVCSPHLCAHPARLLQTHSRAASRAWAKRST